MKKNEENGDADKVPDRPIECSECKKNIVVYYTEIVGDVITRTCMCADCPELKKRLHGAHIQQQTKRTGDVATGLACGNCGTTLESLRVGIPLGCSVCYEVFDDILIDELIASEKIPNRIVTGKKSSPVHIGRAPGESYGINSSLRLLALSDALTETLQKEDYEQAALLRDQIKALTENKSTENKSTESKLAPPKEAAP